MDGKLSIVIVNWNAGSQLIECVNSIARNHNDQIASVVIVDNASTDNSLLLMETIGNMSFPIKFIHNHENMGFSKACNQGAALCDKEYLLFLNPDAQIYKDTLSSTLAFMQDPDNKTVGVCGVQLLDKTGQVSRSCARLPTASSLIAYAIGLDRVFPRFGYLMSGWDHMQNRRVDHVMGAFFLVRNELFRALGGFDERFYVYLEDLDFSCRIQKHGLHSVYLADVKAFHAGGGTSNQVKANRLFYSLRSRLLYAFKHLSPVGALGVLIATLFVEPFSRLMLQLIRRSWIGLKDTFSAYAMLWRWLPQWTLKGVTR